MAEDLVRDRTPARPVVEDPANTTLGRTLHAAARRAPHAPALLSDTRTLTWSELDREATRLAHLLVNRGVRPGDPVGLVCNKRPEVVTAFLACARMGAILTPVNFKLNPHRVRDQFETIGVRCVLAEAGFDGLLAHLGGVLDDPARVFYLDDPGRHGTGHYREISDQPDHPVDFEPTPDTICYYNFTSGTTGRPKGAVTTHRNIQVNAASGVEGFGFSAEDVFLGMFSVFSHPHELFHRSLLMGSPFVILDTLNPRVVMQAIERYRITWMMAVPSFYAMMLDQGRPERTDLGSLRVLESGGAYASAETLKEMESRFDAWFMPVWGSTETTGVALAMPPGSERLPGATGRPAPYYEIRLVDEDDAPVAPGEVGQMIIRSDAVALGYQNRPEETRKHFVDGWYYTGDLVRQDEAGWYHFVGRISEMLKVGGIRVYPLELEKVLLTHPEVESVVVVGHHERLRGEVARAVVVTTPESTLDSRTLKRWCRQRLAVYQVPRIVEFWERIPTLPNGKVDKKAVRAVPVDPQRDERPHGR